MDQQITEETKNAIQPLDKSHLQTMNLSEQIQLGLSFQEQLQLQEAKEIFEFILSGNPQNLEVIDHYTDTLEQLDQIDQMEATLKVLMVEKNQELFEQYPFSYKLLFKFASTQSGKEAISFYQIGIKLLEKQLSQLSNIDKAILKDLGDAYSAIAEIYQTDLLQFKESEQECVNNINQALKYDPMNLDAFFQLANYHLFKEQEDLAVKELKVVYERLMIDEEDSYDQDFKLQTAKLLLEVDLINESKLLLRKAIDQNDKNIEVLYMLAFCLWKLKEYPEAYKISQGLLNMEDIKEDEEILTATKELIAELEKNDLLSNQAVQNDNDEEWMDIE